MKVRGAKDKQDTDAAFTVNKTSPAAAVINQFCGFLLMLARNLACAGFILALSRFSRFSTLRHGPILLFTSFMISGFVRERKRLPSTF